MNLSHIEDMTLSELEAERDKLKATEDVYYQMFVATAPSRATAYLSKHCEAATARAAIDREIRRRRKEPGK